MLVYHHNRAVASDPSPGTPRVSRAIRLFACTMVLSCVFGALQPLTVGASATFALPRAIHPGDLKVVGISGGQRHVERSYVLHDAANKPHQETSRKRHAPSDVRDGHKARDTRASVNDTQIIQENPQPVPILSFVHSSLVSPTVKTPGALISISSTEKLSQETPEIPKITVDSDTTLSLEGLVSPTESVSSETQGSIVPEITAPPHNTTTKDPAQETSTKESLVSNLAATAALALVPTVGATLGDTVEASPVLDPVIPVISPTNLEPETTGNKIPNTVPKTKTNLSPIARTKVAQGDSGTTTQLSPIGTSALGRGQSDNQVVTQIQTLTSNNLSDTTSSGDNTAIATPVLPDSTSAQDPQATTTSTVLIEAPTSATETTNAAEGPTSPPFVNPETSQTPSTKSPIPTAIASGATDAAAPTNTGLAAIVVSPITAIYGSIDVTSPTSITSAASTTAVAATIAPITTAATPIATDGITDSISITPAVIPAATSTTTSTNTDTDATTANTTAATTSDITPIIASATTASNTISISTSTNTLTAINVVTTAAASPVIISVPANTPTGPRATTATQGPEPTISTAEPSTVLQLDSSPSTGGQTSSLATSQLAPISTNGVTASSVITTPSPTNPTTAAPTDPLATENSTTFSSATQPSILLSSIDQTSEPPTPIGTKTEAATPTEAAQNASSPIPSVALQSAVVESSSIKPTFEPIAFITVTSKTINPSVISSSSQKAKGSPSPDPNSNSSQIVPATTPTPTAPVDTPEVVVPITRTSDIPPSAAVTAGTSIDKDGNKVQLVAFHDTTSDQTPGTNNTIAFEGSAIDLDIPFSLIFVIAATLVGQLFV